MEKAQTRRPDRITDEIRDRLIGLTSLMAEILYVPDDIDTTPVKSEQHELERKPMKRNKTIKTALGVIAFLTLYILANTTAPVAWTPQGTIILH